LIPPALGASATSSPRRARVLAWTVGALFLLARGAACPVRAAASPRKEVAARSAPATAIPLTDRQKAVHVLNRLAFGPRPGDVEQVRTLGTERWIAQQLEPQGIDDAAVEAKLSRLTTLNLTSGQLMLASVSDQLLMKMKRMERQQNERARAAGGEAAGNSANGIMERPLKVGLGAGGRAARLQEQTIDPQIVAQLSPREHQLYDLAQQEGFRPGVSVQVVGELLTAKLVRATESKRQLQEVLVDFWSNHFNLDVKKQAVRTLKTADERDVIRPHVLGRFRDLLGASAKSPAMLIYLDNARSTREITVPPRRMARQQVRQRARNGRAPIADPNTPIAMPDAMPAPETAPMAQAEAAPAPRTRGGVNENYARELMELHTLGVNGGYTQKDVQEVARCLTGWSINRDAGTFQFRPFQHDDGAKVVLGHTIPAGGGIRDGEMVLDILAAHPSTAHFIARKLCVRLVADEPPAALVERAAKTFLDSGGDLKAVTRTIVTSPEFFSTTSYRAKIKSPFEYAVSSVRALGGTVDVPDAADFRNRAQLIADGAASVREGGEGRGRLPSLARQIAIMGQPLFSYQAPTGYPENSRQWVSVGALVARLNFALALTAGTLNNVNVTPTLVVEGVRADDHEAVLQHLANQLVGDDLSAATQATLKEQMTPQPPADAAKLTALVLGSPEFQRR
jgi:uncharacterized protein (DUF1800 family)